MSPLTDVTNANGAVSGGRKRLEKSHATAVEAGRVPVAADPSMHDMESYSVSRRAACAAAGSGRTNHGLTPPVAGGGETNADNLWRSPELSAEQVIF